MGHDTHFLSRLDRFHDEHVALALMLYREPSIVKDALQYARIGDQHERVLIALDEKPLGHRVVVQRDGVFITCLGENMANGPWPIVTRAQLDVVMKRRERTDEQTRAVLARSTLEWEAMLMRLATAGHRVPRAHMEALRPMALVWGSQLSLVTVEAMSLWIDFVRRSNAWDPREARHREALERAWCAGWLALHAASLESIAARPVAELFVDALGGESTEHRRAVLLQAMTPAFVAMFPGVTRAINLAMRGGKLLLPSLKLALQDVALPLHMQAAAVAALVGHAVSGSKLSAECSKLFTMPQAKLDALLASQEPDASEGELLRADGAVVVQRAAGEEMLSFRVARARAHRLLQSTAFRDEVPTQQSVDPNIVAAVIANLDQYVIEVDEPSVAEYAHWIGMNEPEQLYLPSDMMDLIYPRAVDPFIVKRWLDKSGAPEMKPVPVRREKTPGRNDPCHCGSGKKFKKCHGG